MEVEKASPLVRAELAAERAHELHEQIKLVLQEARQVWVELAARLYHFHEIKAWKDLGYESFEEYLASPEISLGRSQVFNHIAIFKELVVGKGIQPVELAQADMTKVSEVLPAVRRELVPWNVALNDCLTLGVRDLRDRYRNYEKETGDDFLWVKCPSCGTRQKQHLDT